MIRMDQEVVISYDVHKRIFLLLFFQEFPPGAAIRDDA
jgi:hypothetical protein